MKPLLPPATPVHPQAFVVFVGAGPGAADLITLRGARALGEAAVVLYDALTDPALRSMAPQALWASVGKRGFCDSTAQTHINALLVRYARSHGRVVRLKGGDPSIFGRLEEELQALAEAQIACEVVPGVTAAIAAAAATQRPLTRRGRGRSVCLTTAVTRPASGQAAELGAPLHASRSADTEVFYMAGKQLPALGRALAAQGWAGATPVSVVSNAGLPSQLHSDHTVATLAQAALLHAGRPTVVTVGAGAEPVNTPPVAIRQKQAFGHKATFCPVETPNP
jgi:uroporphyrin-III C-methyltransferase